MGKRLLVAVVAACTSCCKGQQELFEPHRVARQDIAGSAHIAVLSVAPWEKYRDSLQPTFKLAADDALALAIPSTLALEEKFLHALAAKFRIALPTTTSTSTFTAKQTDDAKPSTSAERTTTTSSGDASKLTTGAAPEGARTAAGLPAGSPSPLAASTGTDVMLRYLAATAIYQEVQALNFYVKEAAVRDEPGGLCGALAGHAAAAGAQPAV